MHNILEYKLLKLHSVLNYSIKAIIFPTKALEFSQRQNRMNVELGSRGEFERQNEKLIAPLQKLIYTYTHDTTGAVHIIKNHMDSSLSSNNIKELIVNVLLISMTE